MATSASASEQIHTSKGQLKQQELKKLRKDISSLKKIIKKQQSKKSRLAEEIQQAEQGIAENARQRFNTQTEIQTLQSRQADLGQQLSHQQKQLQIQQQLLSGQMQASYAIGRQEYIKLLLNQQNPATITRVMSYYDYFIAARNQQIAKLKQLLQQIMENKQQLTITRQSLQQKYQLLEQENRTLQQQQSERNALVAKLAQELISKDKKLADMLKNKKALTMVINKLKAALSDIPNLPIETSFAKQKGQFYWPVKGKVRKLFNRWRSMDKIRWQGNIIDAREGAPVHSISHGRIAYSDWLRGYGLITIIDHGDGYMSLYAHNQTLLKEVGDWVENNEIIATVGSSGGIKKAGLYFEIRYNGEPSNPSKWCKKRRS